MTEIGLEDTSRRVEVVPAAGIAWEGTGKADNVAVWLGNATEHDREVIRALVREVGPRGHALRITFPSVETFYLGYAGMGYLVAAGNSFPG